METTGEVGHGWPVITIGADEFSALACGTLWFNKDVLADFLMQLLVCTFHSFSHKDVDLVVTSVQLVVVGGCHLSGISAVRILNPRGS